MTSQFTPELLISRVDLELTKLEALMDEALATGDSVTPVHLRRLDNQLRLVRIELEYAKKSGTRR
jgi:hypothetical protein